MRLRYTHPTRPGDYPNFGDLLNPLIFESLLPGYFSDPYPEVDFLGIGTTLGMLVPSDGPSRRTVVFTSGLGGAEGRAYGTPPKLTELFDIECVRGPLTAQLLGLPPDMAVTDGALLLKVVLHQVDCATNDSTVFVPHMSTVISGGPWKSIATEAGLTPIDPCTTDVVGMVKQIASAPLVVAEAMHAAIVADSFGVPWIAVSSNSSINQFKWTDWCRSLQLAYRPASVPLPVGRAIVDSAVTAKLRGRAPRQLTNAATSAYHRMVQPGLKQLAVRKLRLAASSPPSLSTRSVREERLEELLTRLERIKARYPL